MADYGKEHPVCKEYPKSGGRAALRFFPKGGNDGKTNGIEFALFVNALGKTQLFASPALTVTDFVFIIILAGMLRSLRWKLPCFHKAPVNDDPRQAPYYTDHDQSPYFNQLFAAMYDLPQEAVEGAGEIKPRAPAGDDKWLLQV